MEVEDDKNDGESNETICPKISSQRSAGLRDKLRQIVDETLESVGKEKFLDAYKTCYKSFEKKDNVERPALSGSSKEAAAYQEQFNANVRSNLYAAIDETISNLDDKFFELDNLVKTQADSPIVWRPPGDAQKHVTPFDMVAKLEEKKELEDIIQKEAEIINVLKKRLMKKRDVTVALNERLSSKIDEISDLVSSKTVETSDSSSCRINAV